MAAIRSAKPSDASWIAVLEERLFSDAWSEKMILDCLSKAYYRVMVCVDSPRAMVDGESNNPADTPRLMGYLISTHIAGESELLRIGVAPEYRGLGNGSLLMRSFVQECEEGDCPEAFLEVRASNASAIRLYEKFGFTVVGKRKNYYYDPEEDACLMAGKMRMPEW